MGALALGADERVDSVAFTGEDLCHRIHTYDPGLRQGPFRYLHLRFHNHRRPNGGAEQGGLALWEHASSDGAPRPAWLSRAWPATMSRGVARWKEVHECRQKEPPNDR